MAPTQQPRYVVISPVRDEAQHIEKTIQSMVGQKHRPQQWIVVNDGSSDNTGAIVDRWAAEHPWITPVHRPDRGRRAPGGGVVEAFNAGYQSIASADWDFLVKLDGDLEFEPAYFARCFAEFESDPKLGIGGGIICHVVDGKLVPEPNPKFHVRGATKIYKRACWDAIGGLIAVSGWDTIDELKANMLGWSTRTFPELPLTHHRFTGAATGAWQNAVKNGRGSYITGYHPMFILLRCFNQLFRKPSIVGSVGLFYGYVTGYLRRVPQVPDKQLIEYVRKQQLRRMISSTSVWR